MKPINVVADSTYPNMYRLQWEDGVLSADMYNLSRAKDHLRRLQIADQVQTSINRRRVASPMRQNEVPATPVAADMENA